MTKITSKDYPIYNNRPELIRTFSGKALDEITIDAILKGDLTNEDVRLSPETLELQAQVAEASGRWFVASNFRRAAELCLVPDEKVLMIYDALRPERCTAEEMEAMAVDLETNYNAKLNAALIREAAEAYAERGFLKKDDK